MKKVVDLMIATESDVARKAYDQKLREIEREKALTAERIASLGVQHDGGLTEKLRTAAALLSSHGIFGILRISPTSDYA